MSTTLTVTVDPGLCQGHGRCFDSCPEVFEPDVEGYATVRDVEVGVDSPLAEQVHRAVAGCPERAIQVAGTT